MKKQLQLLIAFCLLLSAKVMAQQDAQFSQYMFNGMYINPAYAGFKQNLNINAFYRTQWSGFEGAPKTMTLSVDAPMADNRMGLGFQVASDKIGITDELAAYGIYSYRIPVNDESFLSFGLGVGFYRFAFKGNNGIVSDPTDPLSSENASSSFNPEVKFGLFYNTETFYLGVSANNLLSPYIKSDPDISTLVPRKSTQIYLTSGVALPLSDNVVMKPSFLLKQDIKGYSTLDLNTFFLFYDRLWVGAAYRSGIKLINKQPNQPTFNSNAAILMSELFLGEKFRVGYAYDMSLSAVKDLNASAHEISLSYSLDVENLFPPSSPAPRIKAVTERNDNRAAEKAQKQKEREVKEAADKKEREAKEAADKKERETREADKVAKQKEREAKEAADKEAKAKQREAVKEKPKAPVVEPPVEKKEEPKKEEPKPVKEKLVKEKKIVKPVETPKEEKPVEEKPVKEKKEKPVKEVKEKPVETPKEEKVDTKAAEKEAAKAAAAEAKAREKAEAKERAEEEKREKEAKRVEEQKEREAQKERERAEAKEKEAEKERERLEKAKAEQAKEVETAQQKEERRQAEKEEAKRIKKLKRQKGAMVTPRYF
ncbi:PorP/SprF family type IX secretion system membrane protein [Solitalea canadensis]|uniref:Bacteroidetes-specific putative membrane protein n=1 Tax=Solitalea canadensis (strain ATCC 29591 / DSM 3403 / JCM 21819 / LMG 8368 / NBRC 15130 / NCIMB 12057 / USAM 9D) TaxID=929556 RepID=H8KTB8_SOLCM|nr:type IX secretion system membrane protein PorP/SprF [Solitalea canadensis]AFD06255.1 Bacteroidetes-specific putative membrane protein [Solitalea canadensis DSM 3403]